MGEDSFSRMVLAGIVTTLKYTTARAFGIPISERWHMINQCDYLAQSDQPSTTQTLSTILHSHLSVAALLSPRLPVRPTLPWHHRRRVRTSSGWRASSASSRRIRHLSRWTI